MSSSDHDGGGGGGGPKLPHDVAVEILKRLPARSLLRFRCVSRSWRSAIDDPRFVALHWSHSALHASSRHLACLDCGDDAVQNRCSLFPNVPLSHPPPPSQIEIPFVAPPNRYAFVGSCNGLICLSESSSDGTEGAVYLWNLFTRKHKPVRLPRPERRQPLSVGGAHVVLGFCFDAKSNDYRVVRIIRFVGVRRRKKPRVEVYSLHTDSWKTLELECEVPILCDSAVFLNGNLHWYSFNGKGDGYSFHGKEDGYVSIALFNVAGEVFDEMAMPEQISLHFVLSMAVLNDSLAVFFSSGEANSACFLWVMKDYGVLESWTKLYTFEVTEPVTRFDGFTWNGELLMKIYCEKRVSWNPITGQLSILPLSARYELVPIVESLFPL
ncbi:F-box/kelch-repeat protein At3g06240-like [Eucalyptus grandis]|uniref:F-box/kelch-repeat protein At3g06240-like n=1 Tax=Eucalyptus grandis TaxID=71139 RepID=UPI00192EB322|nr:F-box/kelch-repeat protein At3g06240-like [Eucalyptus grandis]